MAFATWQETATRQFPLPPGLARQMETGRWAPQAYMYS